MRIKEYLALTAIIVQSHLTKAELRGTVIEAVEADGRFADPEKDASERQRLQIRVLGELLEYYVASNESADSFSERFRSDFLQFVSESRFGWGQNRSVGFEGN